MPAIFAICRVGGAHAKGLIDVILAKKEIQTFLGGVLADLDLKPRFKTLITDATSSIEHFRTKCGNAWQPGNTDLSWKSGWPHSATLTLNLYEMTVYACEFDGVIKGFWKNRKSAKDMFATSRFLDHLTELQDAVKTDKLVLDETPDDEQDDEPTGSFIDAPTTHGIDADDP
jgi:hypothetical protein